MRTAVQILALVSAIAAIFVFQTINLDTVSRMDMVILLMVLAILGLSVANIRE
jgi:hypothetical protein